MPSRVKRTREDRKMIRKRILKTLTVMAVLLSLAAVPALAETKNDPLVFTNFYAQGTGQYYTFDPATRLQGGNIWTSAREPDVTSKQYVFNWGTKGLQQGTYRLSIDLGDGTVHDPQARNHVLVSLKR
jgi:hypothetical protein